MAFLVSLGFVRTTLADTDFLGATFAIGFGVGVGAGVSANSSIRRKNESGQEVGVVSLFFMTFSLCEPASSANEV